MSFYFDIIKLFSQQIDAQDSQYIVGRGSETSSSHTSPSSLSHFLPVVCEVDSADFVDF